MDGRFTTVNTFFRLLKCHVTVDVTLVKEYRVRRRTTNEDVIGRFLEQATGTQYCFYVYDKQDGVHVFPGHIISILEANFKTLYLHNRATNFSDF